jgi:hypothetical protein
MRTVATITAIGALVLVSLVAGCGGDDDDGESGEAQSSVPETLTKREYLLAGDRICAEGTAEIGTQALDRYGEAQPSLDQIDEFATEIVAPVLHEQADALRELPPPAGDEREVAAIYDAVDEGADALAENPSLLTEPGTGGAFDDANRLARRYGFSQCGSG